MLCVDFGIVGSIWLIYSYVTIGTSLGENLGGLPGFLLSCVYIVTLLGSTLGGLTCFIFCVWTLWAGVWCCCCIVGYRCVTGALTWSGSNDTSCLYHRRPLCMLVDCCSASFGMMLNNSARLINVLICVSFIVANVAFDVGFYNSSTKSRAASVAASSENTLGIITFWGGNSTTSEKISDIFFVTNTF